MFTKKRFLPLRQEILYPCCGCIILVNGTLGTTFQSSLLLFSFEPRRTRHHPAKHDILRGVFSCIWIAYHFFPRSPCRRSRGRPNLPGSPSRRGPFRPGPFCKLPDSQGNSDRRDATHHVQHEGAASRIELGFYRAKGRDACPFDRLHHNVRGTRGDPFLYEFQR